jgi:hypothetical protein
VESYTIKSAGRKGIIAGKQIKPILAAASSSEPNSSATHIFDGSGLADTNRDRLYEHSTKPKDMWLSAKGQTSGDVEFDLGNVYKLELIKVWNYNEKFQTGRGVKKADISVWTPGEGWKKTLNNYTIDQAEGRDDYDEPTVIRLEETSAQKVRFDNLVNYGDPEYVGLSEVQFFEARGPQAANPTPADKGNSDVNAILNWTPGLNASAHNLYFGFDPNGLKLLGKLKGEDNFTAKLTPLDKNTRCYWRVDEVSDKGSVVKGQVWSFTTGKMSGWWKFDEKDGKTAKDSAGKNDGILKGGVSWMSDKGKIGGALAFDGNDGYVELPKEVGSIGGAITITVWAYPTAVKNWARFIECGNGSFNDNIIFTRSAETDSLIFEVYKNTEDGESTRGRITAENAIEPNKWQFFAATVDNDGNAVIYKNGSAIQKGKVLVPRNTTRELNYIGKSQWEGDLNYKGMMDDVRLYNYALTEPEIKEVYSGKEPAKATDAKMPSIIGETEKTKGNKNVLWVLAIFVAAAVIAALAGRKKQKS